MQIMDGFQINRFAFMYCLEVVLIGRGNISYNLVESKLRSIYKCEIIDCFEHPEYLRIILKVVYKEKYNSIMEEFKLKLEELNNIGIYKDEFFKVMDN